MKKVTNNLVELNPQLAKEWDFVKNIKRPEEYVLGSGAKVSWICNKKHKWDATIRSRSHQNTGCPYCKGRLPTKENNLKKKFPKIAKEWDYEKNDKRPEEYLPSTNNKVWWKCRKEHSFQQVIYSRTLQNLSCPYCSGKKVGYGNDLKTNYPELAKEWDYEKNDKGPEEYLPFTYHKVWWLCPNNHSYQSTIANRNKKNAKGTSCPYCSIPAKRVGYGNDLKTNFPAVTNFWDYEKNENGPEEFLPGSGKKVWFLCPKKHSYNQSIVDFSQGKNCHYCTGHKIGYGNDFQTYNPKLAKEWDYQKNDKGPNEYGPRSDFRAWWLCPNKHSYQYKRSIKGYSIDLEKIRWKVFKKLGNQ